MRTPIIVGNWKMNTSLSDAVVLAQSIKNNTMGMDNIEIVLCPPFVWIYPVAEVIEKSLGKVIKLGSQNIYFQDEGAYTGEISGRMLKKVCEYVIVGHSERRRLLGETDEIINDKVHAVLRNGMKPIVCVGEYKKLKEVVRSAGRSTKEFVGQDIFHQLSSALEKVSKKDIQNVVIAYEPIWAIGTGVAVSGAYAAAVINSLREKIFRLYDWDTAQSVRILYGGSVDSKNITEFIKQPEIDGVLAGGSSLKAKEFIKICEEVAS